MTIGLVCVLRLLNTVLGLACHVSIIGIEGGACCLVGHGALAIRRRASISVSFAIGRLLLAVTSLVVSRLVVVHLIGVVVAVVLVASGGTACWGRWRATEPAGPVHGLGAASAVSSGDAQAEEQENQSANDGDAREHPSAPKVPATLAPTDDSIKVIPISTPVISSEEVHRRSHVCRMEKEAEVDLLADGLWSRKVMRKGRRRKKEEK